MKKKAVFLSVLALLSVYADESAVVEKDIGAYRTIIDRQMFGPLPDAFDPAKPPGQGISDSRQNGKTEQLTKEQAQIQKSVHFSVINMTPAGDVAVGFTDNSNQKEPRHYYLKVGETRDGWSVVSADAATETMTIQKDGIEVAMKLGDKSGTASSPAAPAAPAAAAGAKNGSEVRTLASRGGLLGLRRSSTLRSRRLEAENKRLAREAEQNKREEERKKELEEQREQLRLIQEELAMRRAKSEGEKSESNENENNNAQ